MYSETLIILDFGSQYTQLIARRVRELGVYSIIVPFTTSWEKIMSHNPRGIILSGGPNSIHDTAAPQLPAGILQSGIPILGICYGLQLIANKLGGSVKSSVKREYGKSKLTLEKNQPSVLLDNTCHNTTTWMSHGDHVSKPPAKFVVTATSNGIIAVIENSIDRIFGLQFHPEVVHTACGVSVLKKFIAVCDFKGNWMPVSIINEQVAFIRSQVKEANVVCALSGGVDSSVAAALVNKAINKQQQCIFVDTGLLRANEYEEVLKSYKHIGLSVKPIRAASVFLKKLTGISDPEQKRKIIGTEFIRIFEKEAKKLPNVQFLVQGTLYPDVVESVPVNGASVTIKSHHNVGGLPEKMHLKLIEPLRQLFKDEVRTIGRELGLPAAIVQRQPFPGPGLAVRIIGDITLERIALLQKADDITRQEIENHTIQKQLWQFFAILLPIQTVGVMGDNRTYEQVVAIRAVQSSDGMTATWAPLPHQLLEKISSRIVNEVAGINRVVYDITSKPPATIEWE